MEHINECISKSLDVNEKILWQGKEENIEIMRDLRPQKVIMDLIGILGGIACLIISIGGIADLIETIIAESFDPDMILAFLLMAFIFAVGIAFPITAIKLTLQERSFKFTYVMTDNCVYSFITVIRKNKSTEEKDTRLASKVNIKDLCGYNLVMNTDGTATVTLGQTPFAYYNGCNYRDPNGTTAHSIQAHMVLSHIKDHETACKYITILMNSSKHIRSTEKKMKN